MKIATRLLILLPGTILLSLAAATAQPRIKVIEGASYDWGKVVPGVMKTTLHVVNTGTDTLDISHVGTSCGCTTAPIDRKRLGRGDTARLDVSIDMKNRSGAQAKEVVLASNDTTAPSYTIRFTAIVERDLEVYPTLFPTMTGLTRGMEVSSSVDVTNTGTETIHLKDPYLEGPDMHARFTVAPGRDLKPGEKATVTAYITPQNEGYLVGEVVVPSSSRSVPEARVRIVCQVKEATPAAAAATPTSK